MYTQQLCRAERSLRIENITSLIKCTGDFLQPPHEVQEPHTHIQ
jgi:hypothetical protein